MIESLWSPKLIRLRFSMLKKIIFERNVKLDLLGISGGIKHNIRMSNFKLRPHVK